MSYTVGDVARAAGVTVRTLHHYDAVGLLSPSGRTAAGYRRYGDGDLVRLQQVLCYRELGFRLEEIGLIGEIVLGQPVSDRQRAQVAELVRENKQALEHKIKVLQRLREILLSEAAGPAEDQLARYADVLDVPGERA